MKGSPQFTGKNELNDVDLPFPTILTYRKGRVSGHVACLDWAHKPQKYRRNGREFTRFDDSPRAQHMDIAPYFVNSISQRGCKASWSINRIKLRATESRVGCTDVP